MTFIPIEEYTRIVEVMPILCVDIVLQNLKGEYLLVRRANEPLKDQWWVIGGRVLKFETMEQAALRKIKEETGLEVNRLEPLGYYEDVFDKNPFNLDTKLHAVSVVFRAVIGDADFIKLDSQSKEWKYSKALPDVFRIKTFADKGGLTA